MITYTGRCHYVKHDNGQIYKHGNEKMKVASNEREFPIIQSGNHKSVHRHDDHFGIQ